MGVDDRPGWSERTVRGAFVCGRWSPRLILGCAVRSPTVEDMGPGTHGGCSWLHTARPEDRLRRRSVRRVSLYWLKVPEGSLRWPRWSWCMEPGTVAGAGNVSH